MAMGGAVVAVFMFIRAGKRIKKISDIMAYIALGFISAIIAVSGKDLVQLASACL